LEVSRKTSGQAGLKDEMLILHFNVRTEDERHALLRRIHARGHHTTPMTSCREQMQAVSTTAKLTILQTLTEIMTNAASPLPGKP